MTKANKQDFTPRDYQIQMLEAALSDNIIACLGTGTGKTYIGVMLLKEMAYLLQPPFEKNGKRAFFLVPTVPLVHQQSNVLKSIIHLSVGAYWGGLNVDNWSKDRWTEEFTKHHVLVMTAEIFRVILEHGFLALSRVSLIIFDECHRAVKNHPYRAIMRNFDIPDSKDHPKVLGLTASILNGKCDPGNLNKRIKDLEDTLRSKAIIPTDMTDIRKYGTKPKELLVSFVPYEIGPDEIKTVHTILSMTLNDLPGHYVASPRKLVEKDSDSDDSDEEKCNPYRDAKKYILDVIDVLLNLGPWCAQEAMRVFLEEIGSSLANGHLDSDKVRGIETVKTVMTSTYRMIKSYLSRATNTTRNLIGDLAPQKLQKLLEILRSKHPSVLKGDEPLCGVVFVEKRFVAFILKQWLAAVAQLPEYKFINPNFMVGHGAQLYSTEIKEICMASKTQEQLLKDFRSNVFNLLVASSVIEEGMDVPQCNVVVRFDPPTNFRAYVQSKGRARSRNSIYVLMTPADDNKYALIEDLANYNAIEKILKQYCKHRDIPTEEEIDEHMADQLKEPYMPFKVDGGARVTMSSAISLLNRYCSKLMGDSYTILAPRWKLKKVDLEDKIGYQCTISLPLVSPIREPIVGDVMHNKRNSKMAAALDACKVLHQNGELDDNLLPIKFELELDEDCPDMELYRTELRLGASNKKSFYPKKIVSFQAVRPNENCYMYVVQMKLTEPIRSVESIEEKIFVFDPDTSQYRFVLLSTSCITKVIPFPMYTDSGKVMVNLEERGTISLSVNELHLVHTFHEYTFTKMLTVAPFPLRFNSDHCNQWLLAPIKLKTKASFSKTIFLDWDLMKNVESSCKLQKPMPELKKKTFKFDEKLYVDTVISPVKQLDELYYVMKVDKDVTPMSPFPKPAFYTYVDFFEMKEKYLILNKNDPMLEVKHVGNPIINMPGYFNRKGLFVEQSKTRLSRRVHYPAEFVHIHPYPASLHRQAVFLPCVLSRINSLILVEELRSSIVKEAKIGLKSCDWPALDFKCVALPGSDSVQRENRFQKPIMNFDEQPDLQNDPGPSPGLLLEAVTSKHYADLLDLERLETIGDSFLKYAVSMHLFCKYPTDNEGKLTVRKTRQISNANLLKLGKRKQIPSLMCYMKMEPRVNWLPPCFVLPEGFEKAQMESGLDLGKHFLETDMKDIWEMTSEQICAKVLSVKDGITKRFVAEQGEEVNLDLKNSIGLNLRNQNCIGNKNVADCVEALIGAYVISMGAIGGLHFLNWLGVEIFPEGLKPRDLKSCFPIPTQIRSTVPNEEDLKIQYFAGLDSLETSIQYVFKDKMYLLEALWHPSCDRKPITGCYQRLEFLGDAVLDYVITKYLYEDPKRYGPGELTDLRMALVNNDFFAKLAVRIDVHKHMKYLAPNLLSAIRQFVEKLQDNDMDFFEMVQLSDCDGAAEELEVPKVLGDVVESIAGAIYLDSGLSLQTVWEVFLRMMDSDIDAFRKAIPKNPIRDLYELFPGKVSFNKLEKTMSKNKMRVSVDIETEEGNKRFVGIALNKKTAKLTAAKIALKTLCKS